MSIDPRHLPKVRDAMIAYIDSPSGAKYWAPDPEEASLEVKAFGEFISMDQLRVAECYRFAEATLFAVSPEMVEFVRTAAASLEEWRVRLEDIPAETGLCYFPTPIAYTDDFQAPVATICWTATGTGLLLTLYLLATPLKLGDGTVGWGTRPPGGLCFHGFLNVGWEEGNPVTLDALPEGETRVIWSLITTWLLMQEPFVDEEVVYASRSSRRRSQKSGIPVTGVRVLTLRGRAASAGRDGPGEQREYHHRWIVRGHWRQQWHPSRQEHRPRWIAPHVKGPDDKPLSGGERVYLLKR